MASISKKISETGYKRVGDTQGLLIPAPLKSTVFKPVVPDTMAAGTNYILTPEQIVLNDLGIDSEGFIPVKTGDCLIIEYPQMQFTASGTPSGSWFIDCFLADKTTVWETLSPWAPTYNNNLTPSSTYVRIMQDGYIRFRLQMSISVTNAQLGTGSGERATRIYVTKLDQRVPYIIANKGALVSSDDMGKVKIDADDGTMSISGEVGTVNGITYSINRPDLWPNGIEIDFGNNLYGMRKEGTISVTAGGSTQIGFGSSATKFIDGNGEYQRGVDTVWHSVNGTVPSGFTSMLFRQGNIRWALNCDYAITDAPYNVWVTYKK